jgi:hypothetical protein
MRPLLKSRPLRRAAVLVTSCGMLLSTTCVTSSAELLRSGLSLADIAATLGLSDLAAFQLGTGMDLIHDFIRLVN